VTNIIVTGTGRSYTSLTMFMLEKMGVPVARDYWVDNAYGEVNPVGLYELETHSVYGLMTDRHEGKAVKLILGGFFPNKTNNYTGTPANFLRDSRILLCLRKPLEIAYSAYRLYPHTGFGPAYPLYEIGSFLIGLQDNMWLCDNITVLDTDLYFNSFYTAMRVLTDFANKSLSAPLFEELQKSVKPKIKAPESWPEEHKELGRLVDKIYEVLLKKDFASAISMIKEVYG